MILLGTSGLLAAIDSSQRHHAAAAAALKAAPGPRLLSPFVLAELDYLVMTKIGQAAELALLREVASGSFRLEEFSGDDVRAAYKVLEQYASLQLGLTDASIVVLAQRYGTLDVLTLDERRFRVISGPKRQPFRLFPADAA